MKTYQPITAEIIEKLKAITGPTYVKTDKDLLLQYQTDYETNPAMFHLPEAAVSPANAQEISDIVKLANEYDFPITVRSGGTSLADGAIPVCGGLVLCMDRLNKIIELNEEGMYMTVEAGVRTIDLQNEAKKVGLMYAGDPSSAESCLIGGNLATNAGGNKAVRYGTTRHQVYAIEAVLPTGKIVNLGATLQKCSTGFCLDQLIIGSEGTLGIITKATLKLVPLPPYKLDVLAVFTDLAKATALVPKLIKAGLNPTSVEFMDNNFVRSASDYSDLKLPHYEDGCYDIISIETFNEDELDDKMEKLAAVCEECGATDIVEADDRVWKVRRNCLESTRAFSKVATSEDLVVPVPKIADCIQHLVEESKKYDFRIFCLAHAGDGNLHFQILKCDMSDEAWEQQLKDFRSTAYTYVYNLGGRLSGEHGIGLKRLKYMEEYTDPAELDLMKTCLLYTSPSPRD